MVSENAIRTAIEQGKTKVVVLNTGELGFLEGYRPANLIAFRSFDRGIDTHISRGEIAYIGTMGEAIQIRRNIEEGATAIPPSPEDEQVTTVEQQTAVRAVGTQVEQEEQTLEQRAAITRANIPRRDRGRTEQDLGSQITGTVSSGTLLLTSGLGLRPKEKSIEKTVTSDETIYKETFQDPFGGTRVKETVVKNPLDETLIRGRSSPIFFSTGAKEVEGGYQIVEPPRKLKLEEKIVENVTTGIKLIDKIPIVTSPGELLFYKTPNVQAQVAAKKGAAKSALGLVAFGAIAATQPLTTTARQSVTGIIEYPETVTTRVVTRGNIGAGETVGELGFFYLTGKAARAGVSKAVSPVVSRITRPKLQASLIEPGVKTDTAFIVDPKTGVLKGMIASKIKIFQQPTFKQKLVGTIKRTPVKKRLVGEYDVGASLQLQPSFNVYYGQYFGIVKSTTTGRQFPTYGTVSTKPPKPFMTEKLSITTPEYGTQNIFLRTSTAAGSAKGAIFDFNKPIAASKSVSIGLAKETAKLPSRTRTTYFDIKSLTSSKGITLKGGDIWTKGKASGRAILQQRISKKEFSFIQKKSTVSKPIDFRTFYAKQTQPKPILKPPIPKVVKLEPLIKDLGKSITTDKPAGIAVARTLTLQNIGENIIKATTQQMTRPAVKLGTIQKAVQVFRPVQQTKRLPAIRIRSSVLQRPVSKQRQQPRVRITPIQTQAQGTRLNQRVLQRQQQAQTTGTLTPVTAFPFALTTLKPPTTVITPPTTPFIPGVVGKKRRRRRVPRFKGRKLKYTPSLTGAFFKLSTPEKPKGVFTGFGIRPVIRKRKRR